MECLHGFEKNFFKKAYNGMEIRLFLSDIFYFHADISFLFHFLFYMQNAAYNGTIFLLSSKAKFLADNLIAYSGL